jgi:hypothetical protein
VFKSFQEKLKPQQLQGMLMVHHRIQRNQRKEEQTQFETSEKKEKQDPRLCQDQAKVASMILPVLKT